MQQSPHLLRSLTIRYILALGLIAASATAAFFVLSDVIGRQRDEAAVVNVAGRQRMLSQKIAFLSAQLASAPEMAQRVSLAAEILDAADLMEKSHRALLYGNPAMGIHAPTSSALLWMYNEPPLSVSWRVENYIESARVIATVGMDTSLASPAYREIAVTAPEVLEVLDQVVQQYQQEGEAKVGMLAFMEQAAWLTTLFVLTLEAIFIFRPMMRTIRQSIEAEEARRAEAETEAHVNERRNATLMDTIADAVVTTDEIGTIRDFSRAAEAMFGRTREAVLGCNIDMLLAEEGFSRHLKDSAPRVLGIEAVGLRADGSHFPVELALGRLETPRGLRFTGVVRDVTERRKAEETIRQAQKMEVVGQLSGGIAHDFNNLLGIVAGNLEILDALLRDHPAAMARINTAQRAVDRGADLTRKLLAFARRRAGNPLPSDVNDLVRASSDLLDRLRIDRVTVVLDLAPSVPSVLIDPGEFQDCILNLALNARDAMQPTGGTLTLTTREEGGIVRVSVADTGCGIPEDLKDRIFEPFFTTKEAGKGTGLGLSMVYGFAQRSGGTVSVDSRPGDGTVFTLGLPAHGGHAGSAPPEPTECSVPGGDETLLVVDDEPDLREMARSYLISLGYRCVTAGDAAQALAVLETEPEIDLMITDVVMPGSCDGRELARLARMLSPGLKVVVTSGVPGHEGGEEPFLPKPYRRADLAAIVRRTLDRNASLPA